MGEKCSSRQICKTSLKPVVDSLSTNVNDLDTFRKRKRFVVCPHIFLYDSEPATFVQDYS